jgi:photosystem II stability/assembly factor-like uncharacterized protein
MSKHVSKPCAHWAEQLTQASFQSPPGAMSADLKAHLNTCPACAAARAEYLYTAAALHQAPAPAPLPGLPAQLLRVWAAEEQRRAPAHVAHIKEVSTQTTDYENDLAPVPIPPARWQRVSRRASAAISAIAAVLVIAIVTIALFASHTSGKPTATSAPQNGSQTWQALPHLAHLDLNHQTTLLAPSNPRVVYQIVLTNQGTQASLRRSDDGATWQFVDQGLTTEQRCIEDIAVPRSGTTLFATTLNQCSSAIYNTDTAQLWRSDDAGTHWTSVSSLSAILAYLLEVVNVSSQAQPVLIDRGTPPTLDSMRFSLDNGKTWQPTPTLEGQELAGVGQLGVLRDGSILEQTKAGFYAWKAGDAGWHKVAPALPGTVEGALIVSDSNGKETLYLEVLTTGRNALNFYRITLA